MNDDLISRQAAIDAIRASTSKYTGFMEMEMYTDDDAVEAIEGVPSVEPEIVRCKRCIHNVGIRDNTEFYDKDIVCDYWESDGLYSTDFCSYGKRADE